MGLAVHIESPTTKPGEKEKDCVDIWVPRVVVIGQITCLLIVLVVALASPASDITEPHLEGQGCGFAINLDLGVTHVLGIDVAGQHRTFRLRVPKRYNGTSMPLVFDMHGWGSTSENEERSLGLTELAEQEGFMVVYPDGMDDTKTPGEWGSWNAAGSSASPGPLGATCNATIAQHYAGPCYYSCLGRKQGCTAGGCDWTTCTDDVAFLEGLLQLLEDKLCVDRRRIYASGKSNGGMMALELGSKLFPRFAAVVTGAASPHYGFAVAPTGAVSLLMLHGTTDRSMPGYGTGNPDRLMSIDGWYYTPAPVLLSTWAISAGCASAGPGTPPAGPGTPQQTTTYTTQWQQKAALTCSRYGHGCTAGVDVVGCTYEGGHVWPQFAADVVWGFFENHPKSLYNP